MKKWILIASKDAIDIDFETIIESDTEPEFWECQNIADNNNCLFWCIGELTE